MSRNTQSFDAATKPANQPTAPVPQLHAEEVEAVIAPKLSANHNESLLSARLHAEEVEAVIAPKLSSNHNETILD